MAARKSILIVSAAPSNAIASIARELASRGHFTTFASATPYKYTKTFSNSAELQTLEVDTQSPTSLSLASVTVASSLGDSGFSGLDVLVNDAGVGSSLALLDVMMDETPGKYDAKVSVALSLATIFAGLLTSTKGKVVNLSSSGAFISAPCMSESIALPDDSYIDTAEDKHSHFSAERAITGISEQMRLEPSLYDVSIETIMLQCLLSAAQTSPRVLFPERSSYSSAKSAVSRWTWGSDQFSHSLEPMYSLILEDSYEYNQGWLLDVSLLPFVRLPASDCYRVTPISSGKILPPSWRRALLLVFYVSDDVYTI